MLGNTLGNAHNKRDLGGDGLFDTSSGKWGPVNPQLVSADCLGWAVLRIPLRHEDGRRVSARLLHGVADVGEDREAEMRLAGLLGVCAANNLGA